MEQSVTQPVLCPLTTPQLIDVIMRFVDLYNESANIELYPYQRVFLRRIIESVLEREGAVITGLWSRQSGKSEAITSVAPGLCIILPTLAKAFPDDPRLMMYRDGFWIGIYAPRLQQSEIIYGRIRQRAMKEETREIYTDPDIDIAVTTNRGEQVGWSNGSFVLAQTASEQSNVEGKTFHLIIIDEAQYVGTQKMLKEIQPMLTATNGTMVKIGTAHVSYGGFRDSIEYNLELERKGGKRNHYEFPYEAVISEKRRAYNESVKRGKPNPFHLNYEAAVKTLLDQLGGNIDNPEFAMNYRLLWQSANVGAIDWEHFTSLRIEDLEAGEPRFHTRQVAGLDFGKYRDRTVLTIYEIDENSSLMDVQALIRPGDDAPVFHEKTIIAWCEARGKWREQLKGIVEFLTLFVVDTIVADATGVGDPLVEHLQELLPGINVVPFKLSGAGNDAVYKYYLQELEADRIRFAAGPVTRESEVFQKFEHEHRVLAKEYVGPYIRCLAPEGEHDDYPDSAALGCWAERVPQQARVESSVNPFYASVTAARSDRYRSGRRAR